MIQKLNARHGSTAIAPYRPTTSTSTDNLTWGSSYNRKYYSLEVTQQPVRARMCGFGDKDRRPLAPATVAKITVKDEDGHDLEPDDIDCSFFVVTADLWSADGKLERNLVLHPTSSDRYMTTHAPKKRRMTHPPGSSGQPSNDQPKSAVPPDSSPGLGKYSIRSGASHMSTGLTPLTGPLGTGFGTQGFPFPQEDPNLVSDTVHLNPAPSYNMPPDLSGWASFGMSTSHNPFSTVGSPSMTGRSAPTTIALPHAPPIEQAGAWDTTDDTDTGPFRTWSADPQYGPLAPLNPAPITLSANSPGFDPPPRLSQSATQYQSIELHESTAWPSSSSSHSTSHPMRSQDASSTSAGPHNPPYDQSMYAPASYAQTPSNDAKTPRSSRDTILPSLPGHVYTRTLVGPLVANASRLLDEHRKPGVFFLFQDLSIRTEGSFRLRLRLMNIGAPPSPDSGATSIHTGVSPILAQTFTDAFDVYSAKRFPGVPDTTALSIAFGNQGQKLPLRNRHGSSKTGRRRRRGDSDGSDEDTDG
ncbi:velvet factor-domain-containing protein [Amylostereum chailletii]|nr:velvet factor-domain-containing protein [Amylostereum chailletii]